MRPLLSKKQFEKSGSRLWNSALGRKSIEKFEETEVFSLTPEEAEKCRFEIINMNTRHTECSVHTGNFSHGVTLHPPHLWDIVDGKVYQRKDLKADWVRWTPRGDGSRFPAES